MLPIETLLPELKQTLEANTTALLQAPPGAGKTTRVPLALLDAPWRNDRKILMLEPRRLAARSAARFMAKQLGEAPGQTVGYRTRLDTRVSEATRIEVVTEGILTRLIQNDPLLEDYAAVLFDEFHERSLQADLGLALVRESQQALREDLRLLVMSATLDTEPLAHVLGDVPVLTSEGRAFPVAVLYRPLPRQGRLVDQVVATIQEALRDQTGSLLVFLPGAGEIRRVAQQLTGQLPGNTVLAPLYGNLKAEEQDQAIAPAAQGTRKLVLATAIAETSLTIEGVRVVIDAGQQRRAVFDPNSGMTRLVTGKVSKASAEQRKGRAGRVEPGVCYRLWSESEQFGLAGHTPPEIQAADLAPLVLELAQWGARAPEQVAWIDAPPKAHWQQAVDLLHWLDLLDAEGAITEHGKAARELGLHPRLAHMVIRARALGLGPLAAELAAILEERDLLGPGAGADLHERVLVLRGGRSPRGLDTARLKAVQQAARRLSREGPAGELPVASEVGRVLALAYPDRIARRRAGIMPRYQLSNGKGAVLREDDRLAREEWLVAADLDGKARESTIYLAAPADLATLELDLAAHVKESEEAQWDDRRGLVVARHVRKLGALVLAEKPLPQVAPELVLQGLLDAVRRKGLDSLPWSDRARQWRARVQLLSARFTGEWPSVSDEALLSTLDHWLAPFMTGMQRWSDLARLDLVPALTSLLDYSKQQQLDKLAPPKLTIPTGQSVMLDYTADNGPVLAAKLQALFGWTETPAIAGGRVPVVIHLLSPAQRPLAVTADLGSFWRNVYPDVRKDNRGRYPKHPWPEDPLTAQAQQGVKKRPAH
ncbi:ATP-dependent helicase HrpB [Marinobacter daepoensis]|uniref:ATP-dependent helicase HrpB n=1 Tax=Marinobacter daepoensis TaxID=262077 RepID=A0ABS3BDJ0_9GAMM|nr:ATP-dependent helicase HrpB [Marinobacter daepoensis]MBN7769884.1 ATP-dependent helicase HrpB [Marinobacter daepoensis]MBY6080272.1 ATP-dependent helicase HrpB [Marinobacter daepoensis]